MQHRKKMKLNSNIEYEKILRLVKKLPAARIVQLKADLNDALSEKKSENEISDFQKLLLNGPVMSASQYSKYLKNRKNIIEWRAK